MYLCWAKLRFSYGAYWRSRLCHRCRCGWYPKHQAHLTWPQRSTRERLISATPQALLRGIWRSQTACHTATFPGSAQALRRRAWLSGCFPICSTVGLPRQVHLPTGEVKEVRRPFPRPRAPPPRPDSTFRIVAAGLMALLKLRGLLDVSKGATSRLSLAISSDGAAAQRQNDPTGESHAGNRESNETH